MKQLPFLNLSMVSVLSALYSDYYKNNLYRFQRGHRLGLADAFCKNTGHFVNSVISTVICIVIRKRHRENRETVSIVKSQLAICPYIGWLITFWCVCDVQSHQGLRQQQQINFPEGTVLTRFTARVITM